MDAESKNIEDAKKSIEINKNDIINAKQKKQAFNDKYNEIENLITKIDMEITEIRNLITEKKALSENIKGQINVLREQINSEKHINESRGETIKRYDQDITNALNEIKTDVESLSTIKKQIEFIKINNVEMDENEDKFEKDIDTIKTATDEFKMFCDEENIHIDISEPNDDISIFSNELTTGNNTENKSKLDEIDKKIENEKKLIEGNNYILTDLNSKIDEINDELIATKNLYSADEIKIDNLKNLIERNEGYQNAVKNVIDNKSKFDGIIGVVADIIETSKEYEVAIEVALGNSIQNIVTENVEATKKVINYLKENKLGRVTTLPLQSIVYKENKIYEEILHKTGVIDLAVNIVKFDEKYKNLANYLLKNCLIVDTYDNAKMIFNEYKSSVKIVTLQGELFNPGGAVSGGSYKNSFNIIGRKREYENLLSEVKQVESKISTLDQSKNKLLSELSRVSTETERYKNELNNLNIEKNTLTLNIINDLKLEYSNVSNRARFISDNLSKRILSTKNLYLEKAKLLSNDQDFDSIIREKEQSINGFEAKICEIDKSIEECQEQIDAKNAEKSNSLANRKEFYDAKDKITSEEILLEQESNRLANIIEKSSIKIEDITNSMYENYSLTYAQARERYDDNLGSNDEIKKAVKEKRKVIQDLGPININAIEEYRQIGDRYDLMTTQYEDIKKSEEMIAAIVEELDESMRNQFDTNFKKIKEEFQNVFKILFGGGKANIELVETDEKGVLDAGVAIIVQPPGKKLGNMMQLSGGEKALTAIALLFAIQNLKPSPFCLLDEIEAALDESNVDRFADYLKRLTNDTQFILITHRRGTMEKADRLYGITMQEKGITALVSVDLIENQLT